MKKFLFLLIFATRVFNLMRCYKNGLIRILQTAENSSQLLTENLLPYVKVTVGIGLMMLGHVIKKQHPFEIEDNQPLENQQSCYNAIVFYII